MQRKWVTSIQQPEVDPKRRSARLVIAKEVKSLTTELIDNPDKVQNLVLMDARIDIPYDALDDGVVGLPLEYARQILDKNHNGSFLHYRKHHNIKFSKLLQAVIPVKFQTQFTMVLKL